MAGKKLRDIEKGTWAVQPITLHLANVAAQPGQASDEASATVRVGVRLLLGTETAEVYEKAQSLAKEKGVPEWKDEHPLCRLYLMTCSIHRAVCDVDQDTGKAIGSGPFPDAFFDSVEQVLDNKRIGTDNIAYLYEQWVRWQDEKSARNTKVTLNEAIGAILVDMGAPDSPDSPLFSMGHATLVTCIRIMARPLFSLLRTRSPSGQPETSSTAEISRSLVELGIQEPE